MKERIITNSNHLQKRFPEVYKDFFTKNNFIISCHQMVNRGNSPHIKEIRRRVIQKLPTKLYIGINRRKDDRIAFHTYIEYKNAKQGFEKKDMEIFKNMKTKELMYQAIMDIKEKVGLKGWLDIMMLSENEMNTWLLIGTTQTLLFVVAMYILSGKLDQETLNAKDFMHSEAYFDIDRLIKESIEKIIGISRDDVNSTILFTAALNERNIWLGFDNEKYLEKYEFTKSGNNFSAEGLIDNILNLMDFSIISFWNIFNEFYNKEIYNNMQKQFDELNERFKTGIENPRVFTDSMNFLYMDMFKAKKSRIDNPTNEHMIELYFDRLNKIGRYEVFLENNFELITKIRHSFMKNKTFENELMATIPISSGKEGGSFLCITKAKVSRDTIKKMVEELYLTGYPSVNMTYVSREDGLGVDNIRIEQHLDKNHISDQVKDNDAILKSWQIEEKEKEMIGKHRDLLKIGKESIIFDAIDGKIYINNELTNHKEILSQSGTVEIMKTLFEHMWSYVNNSKFPISSYTKNKNEMVGKIIWPLQKLVKERFHERLDLECTGNMVDFDLKLTPNKINLYLLKKIHQ